MLELGLHANMSKVELGLGVRPSVNEVKAVESQAVQARSAAGEMPSVHLCNWDSILGSALVHGVNLAKCIFTISCLDGHEAKQMLTAMTEIRHSSGKSSSHD